MKYESPQIDKDGLSQRAIELEIKGIKHIPHECPGCGEPASVSFIGSFCRNEICVLYGWRF